MKSAMDAEIIAVDALLAEIGLAHGRRGGRGRAAKPEHGVKSEPQNLAPEQQKAAGPSEAILMGRKAGNLEVLEAVGWGQIPWLMHGFSTRGGGRSMAYKPGEGRGEAGEPGELNLGFTAQDTVENVLANRAALVDAVSRAGESCAANSPAHLATLQQIHSGITHRVDHSWCEAAGPAKGDGLMTDEPGLLLGVQTADCIPVLVVDRKRRAVAAFHAGWRGTLKRIVEGGIGRMRLQFGSQPEDLEAAVGPGIGGCCYAVGEEVRSAFTSQFGYADALFSDVYDSDPVKEKYPMLFLTARAPGHSNIGPSLHLDLAKANRRQLLDAGLRPDAIHGGDACTSCDTGRFFSYRAERGFCGRMMSVIGVRPSAV